MVNGIKLSQKPEQMTGTINNG